MSAPITERGISVQEQKAPSLVLTIFGATGDLAKRKLFPSLYRLYKKNLLNKRFAIVGVARTEMSDDEFRNRVKESVQTFGEIDNDIDAFTSHFYYVPHDVTNKESYIKLKQRMDDIDRQHQLEGNRIFYLAMAPEFFGTISLHLKESGLTETNGFKRLIIEKPFGHDLSSAQKLNKEIRESFHEEEIFRIDHYLGKEMVQNIEVIRFANNLFEPLWNNRYISNIQITSSESLGVEDRGRYYETSGALKDMVQNHILQMVSLLAMEPPVRLSPDDIRAEKIKVLKALRPIDKEKVHEHFVRGQYGTGKINGEIVPGYREEPNVHPQSNTETFVAGRIFIDNFRWAGVPFYIRTGKRMPMKTTKIVVQFKDNPFQLYYKDHPQPNLLVLHIQPEEGITLHFNAKKTGQSVATTQVKLNFSNQKIDGINTPEAYEKLLFDCMLGDSTNFTHWEEVALSWKFVDPISEVWQNEQSSFPNYAAFTNGPESSNELLALDGHFWWSVNDLEIENC